MKQFLLFIMILYSVVCYAISEEKSAITSVQQKPVILDGTIYQPLGKTLNNIFNTPKWSFDNKTKNIIFTGKFKISIYQQLLESQEICFADEDKRLELYKTLLPIYNTIKKNLPNNLEEMLNVLAKTYYKKDSNIKIVFRLNDNYTHIDNINCSSCMFDGNDSLKKELLDLISYSYKTNKDADAFTPRKQGKDCPYYLNKAAETSINTLNEEDNRQTSQTSKLTFYDKIITTKTVIAMFKYAVQVDTSEPRMRATFNIGKEEVFIVSPSAEDKLINLNKDEMVHIKYDIVDRTFNNGSKENLFFLLDIIK